MAFLRRGPVILLLVLVILVLALYIMPLQQTRPAPASLQPFTPHWSQPHASDMGQSGNLIREEEKERGRVGEQKEQEGIRDSRPAHQPDTSVADNQVWSRHQSQNPVAGAVLASRNANGWAALNCDRDVHLRKVTQNSPDGDFTMYIYNSSKEDASVTRNALAGHPFFERNEISQFLKVSSPLPLIDLGANLGLVTLQAAKQGRRVVAVEPVPQNALRLCRSVVDFGHAALVRVVQNAVSSEERSVSLELPGGMSRTWYRVSDDGAEGKAEENGKRTKSSDSSETVFAIGLDRLLDVVPFTKAAMKIDVEGHEGHVFAKADRLFQELDIPLVWMEWQHVKGKAEFGGAFVVQFMKKHSFAPYNLMTGQQLSFDNYLKWPFTVLWKKSA